MVDETKLPDMRKKANQDLLGKIRKRYKTMYDADHENRLAGMEDMKFVNVPGYQWEDNMKQERGERPCYEFNKTRVFGKRIINDMRANRPAGKVRPVEGGDKDTAETIEGLCRNILDVSDFDTTTDYEAEYQVNAGMGCWRVTTDYVSDDAFEQDIRVEMIENPFTCFVDPSCKDYMKRDAQDWCITEKIPRREYKARWPKAEVKDFDDALEFDDDEDWQDEETVRIAEYWWKEPESAEIWKLDDGSVVDSETDEAQALLSSEEGKQRIVDTRTVMRDKICWCILSGDRLLEPKTRWAGRMFPFVMVFGEYVVIDGRPYWWGLPRFAKDAQRSYNVSRTAVTETIAQAPKSFHWATTTQAAGLTEQWAEAHKKNFPFLLYNPDPQAPGEPKRLGGPDIPIALVQELELASDELKATMGLFDASFGARSNETSGRAIYARQQEGEIATFNYRDNMVKGVQRTYEILIDLIPEIYDTERELRVLGEDGAESYVPVNQVVVDHQTGQAVRIHDLSVGKYDVTVTAGPNFATKRQEAAEIYGDLVQRSPEIMQVAGDLLFKSMDLPYSEEIAERMRALLPPQIQQSLASDAPPEVQQAMAQAAQAMQAVEARAAEVEQMAREATEEISQAKAEKSEIKAAKAEISAQAAEVERKRAEFEKFVAEEMLKLHERGSAVQRDAALVAERISVAKPLLAEYAGITNKGEQLSQVTEAVTRIDDVVSEFMQSVDDAVTSIESRRVEGGKVRREGAKIIADVEYDDGSKRTLAAVRKNGELQLVPEPNAGA